jgi:hypothetical protein
MSMWTSKSAPSRLRTTARLVPLAAALGMFGCTADYATNSTAPVILRVTSVNAAAVLNSDVRVGMSTVIDDTIPISLAVRPTNQNFTNVPQVTMAVFIERYEVSYYRSDGRSVQGVDVPFTISGNLTQVIDVALSGSTSVPIVVVRAQAKLEPPLLNLWGPTDGTLDGQALTTTMFARITVHGRTLPGQAVQATGVLQITFADFLSS